MFNVSPVNFKSKYQIDANQKMTNNDACLKRDFAVGVWINQADNNVALQKTFKDFITGEYEEDVTKPCNLTFELDDKYDYDFEETMKAVGQKFDKLA